MGRGRQGTAGEQRVKEFSGLSNQEYTIWELLASRYIQPESLQAFAQLSHAHREILQKLAGAPSFWENLKATAMHHAMANFDPVSLLVMEELAQGPLILVREKVLTGVAGVEVVDGAEKLPMWNGLGRAAEEVEGHVRRFLKFCYFPLHKTAACKSMLVLRNVREIGSGSDAARMESRVAWIIRKHCKKQLSIKGAYRLGEKASHARARGQRGLCRDCQKGNDSWLPYGPVLVIFKNVSDAEFVFNRRGIFRQKMRIHVEKCSMPWDMDMQFRPGEREQL